MLNFDVEKEYATLLDAAAQQIKETLGEVEELQFQGGQDKKMLMLLAGVAKILSVFPTKKELLMHKAGFHEALADDIHNIEIGLKDISKIKSSVDTSVSWIGKNLKDKYYSKDNEKCISYDRYKNL